MDMRHLIIAALAALILAGILHILGCGTLRIGRIFAGRIAGVACIVYIVGVVCIVCHNDFLLNLK